MAKKRGYYEGMSGARAQESRDGAMVGNATGAFANMPTSPIVKMYPRGNFGGMYNLNDGIKGIDVQMGDDNKQKKGGTFPEKY